MENNKMRFKMYKSGKNWMVAGLMTTAVLAGLTLSNVNNDVVAHADADVNTTALTSNNGQKQEVSQETKDAQQQIVNNDQSTVNDLQGKVASAQNDYNSTAATVNSGAAVVNSAANKVDSLQNQWGIANREYQNAHKATKAAQSQANADKPYYDEWNKNESAQADKDSAALSDAKAAKSNAQASWAAAASDGQKMNDASAAYTTAHKAFNSASAANDSKTMKSANADMSAAVADVNYWKAQQQKDTDAANAAVNSILGKDWTKTNFTGTGAENVKKALDALDTKITARQKTVDNHAGYKAAADRYQADQSALVDAQTKERAAKQNVDTLKAQHDQAIKDLVAARVANQLPDSDMLTQWQKEAAGAKRALDADNNAAIMQQVNSAQSYLDRVKADVKQREQDVANVKQDVKDDQDLVNEQQQVVDGITDHNSEAYTKAKARLDSLQKTLKADQDTLDGVNQRLADGNKALSDAQKDLDDLKASDPYIKNRQDAEYRQSIIDRYNNGKKNYDAVYGNGSVLAALQAKVTALQNSLNDAQAQYAKDKAVLDNMVVKGQTPDTPAKPDDNKPDNGNTNDTPAKPDNNKGDNGNTNSSSNTTANKGQANVKSEVAANKTVAAKASVLAASEVQNNDKANDDKLSQTGNADSAAVVALGAFSAMLGFGLVAKKREF